MIGIRSDGKFIALEVKLPNGRPTERQKAFVAMVIRFGGLAGIVHNVKEAEEIVGK